MSDYYTHSLLRLCSPSNAPGAIRLIWLLLRSLKQGMVMVLSCLTDRPEQSVVPDHTVLREAV